LPGGDDEHGSHQAGASIEIAWGNGDGFVWSETFKQGDGAHPASADEGDRSEMPASSEAPAADPNHEGDLHFDGDVADIAHSVTPATAMAHWLM